MNQFNKEAKMDAIKKAGIDICGFCGLSGADKMPHPVRWPGEEKADTKYVHAECEEIECRRAHSSLTNKEIVDFLKTVK